MELEGKSDKNESRKVGKVRKGYVMGGNVEELEVAKL